MMKAGIFPTVFLVNVIDRVQQIIVVALTKHFADRHQLPLAGAVRTDVAGKVHFASKFIVEWQLFESAIGHGYQLFRQVKEFVGFAFALAFADFKCFIFGRGFVHAGFYQKGCGSIDDHMIKDIGLNDRV